MNPDEEDVLDDWFRAAEQLPRSAEDEPSSGHTHIGGGAIWAPPRRRRLIVLVVVTAALWGVAGALIVAGRDGAEAEPATEQAQSPAPVAVTATATVAPALETSACAEMVVHERITRDDGGRWVDAAATQRLRPMSVPVPLDASEHAVLAVVRAVVLEGDGRTWERRVPARYAVPLAVTARDCRDLATPWPLPTTATDRDPASAASPPSGAIPSTSPDRAVPDDARVDERRCADALRAAGYRDVRIQDVGEVVDGVVVVDAEAVPPSGTRQETVRVWLESDAGLRLVGT